MELYIAGGCGEHGRNCFVLTGKEYKIAVDCGIKEGDLYPTPYLKEEEIKAIKYLFLTHSHKDHVGALEWFYEQGFEGKVILTKPTLNQMKVVPKEYLLIDEVAKVLEVYPLEKELRVSYGKSGHCAGSVWYSIQFEEKSIIFSGDYIETSEVYPCDKIEKRTANLALLDCAYQMDKKSYKEQIEEFLAFLDTCNHQKRKVVLPVPKFGRSVEILYLILTHYGEKNIYMDEGMKAYLQSPDWKSWMKEGVLEVCKKAVCCTGQEYLQNEDAFLYILTDPQLVKEENQKICRDLATNGGAVVFTGNLDSGSYSHGMVKDDLASFLRFPVHMNLEGATEVANRNDFRQVVVTHSEHKLAIGDIMDNYLRFIPKDRMYLM